MKEKIKETVKEETVLPKKKETPATKPKKKKGKPRGGNSPMIGMNGYNLEPGDNTKFLNLQIELFNMPNIDLQDVNQVAQRLSDYYGLYGKYDLKPTVAGMALALNGHDRRWLYGVTHDVPTGGNGYMANIPPEVATCIKKAYFMLGNLWETYMSTGKLNPVAGIFLGKNNFDYLDKVEHVVTPNINPVNDFSADDIRSRYTAIETSDSDTEN